MFKLRSIAARLILVISLTVAAAADSGDILDHPSARLDAARARPATQLQYDSVIAARSTMKAAPRWRQRRGRRAAPVADAIAGADRGELAALLDGPMRRWRRKHPTDHLPDAAGSGRLPVFTLQGLGDDISARRNTVVEATKTAKPIVGVEPGREALHFWDDADRARRQDPRHVDIALPLARNSSIGPRNASVSTCRAFVRRQGIKKLSSTFGDTVVASRTAEERVRPATALHRDTASTTTPRRSMSGRSGTMPASRSPCRSHQGHHRIRGGGSKFSNAL